MMIMNILKERFLSKKFIGGAALALLLLVTCFQIQAPAGWERPLQPSMSGGGLVCLSLNPLDTGKFLAANHSQLFEGSGASNWKMLWSNGERGAGIEKILTFSWTREFIFLLVSGKIFMGKAGTSSWKPVYDGGSSPEKVPLSFVVMPQNPNQWFVGTPGGLWTSEDAGKTWSRSDILSSSGAVTVLFAAGPKLFIADESSLYLSLNGSPARAMLTLPRKEVSPSETSEHEDPETDRTAYARRITSLVVDDGDARHFFLGTFTGAFESRDGGYHWLPLSRSGMQSTEVLDLAYASTSRRLFAATPRGIYQYQPKDEAWKALSDGTAQPYSKSIAVMPDEKLIAVTGDGFMEYQFRPEAVSAVEIFKPPVESLALFRKLIELEPSARELHQKVIKYADVGNGKINRWHIASRVAGILPDISFGKSVDRNASISTYSGKYITGPEDVSKTWDADVSWDLGDLIYSSNQTSIDSREKLMVELRQDLLSEATRVYFERRRLQTDIVYVPSLSEQEHLERLIRLDELTALLDGMTNGFFSKRLERIYTEKPELNRLWIYQTKDGG